MDIDRTLRRSIRPTYFPFAMRALRAERRIRRVCAADLLYGDAMQV
jgi:hypothetical protein